MAVLDQRAAEGGSGVALAAAGGSEQQQIGALAQPGVAGGECHDVCLADHRHRQEVEVVERLARRQTCFGKVALDAPFGALGDLEFGKCREEPSGRPALLVGASGDILPQTADGGQPQLVQQQRQSGDVGSDLAHAETSTAWLLSNAS